MKMIDKNYCGLIRVVFLLVGILVSSCPVGAVELGFKAVDKRMLFTIPYETVPEVNALFVDQGERVVLVLPDPGLKAEVQKQFIDDDWVTAYGVEKDGLKSLWYLEKRDPLLKVKSFLALERKESGLQVVLLKEYRSWLSADGSEETAALSSAKVSENKNRDKMARVQRLLSGTDAPAEEGSGGVSETPKAPPSLLMSGLRSLIALVFLALIIVALALLLKRYRRGRGGLVGSGLVKVLGVETVSGKHQVMLLELLDEVMVVGISGEQMTVLTTINDPDKVEELRLLKDNSRSGRRFGGYLKGLLERESEVELVASPATPGNEVVETTTYQRPARTSAAKSPDKPEELPENYQEVVSQIKDRLKNNDRSQRG